MNDHAKVFSSPIHEDSMGGDGKPPNLIEIGPEERPDRMEMLFLSLFRSLRRILAEERRLAAEAASEATVRKLMGLGLLNVAAIIDPASIEEPAIQPIVLPGIFPIEVAAPILPVPSPEPEAVVPVPGPPPPEPVPVPKAVPKAANPTHQPDRRDSTYRGDRDGDYYKARKAWAQKNYLRKAKGLPPLPKPEFPQPPPEQEKAKAKEATASPTALEDG